MKGPISVQNLIMDLWKRTTPDLEERHATLPLGTYKGGDTTIAWPGIIADPAKRVGNALDAAFKGDQSYYFGDDGHLTNDAIMAGIDATGLAMTGGLGAGLVGGFADNAVGSAGAKLTKPQGIRAYHGSPHDFDRFDLSKIGTGEGAQAYGHGLYFAGDENVARHYRDALGAGVQDAPVTIDGNLASPAVKDALQGLDGKTVGDVRSYWQQQAQYMPDQFAPLLDAIKDIPDAAQIGKGRMYEVNIRANPEDFLDWDKPFSQQGEVGRKAALTAGPLPEGDDPLLMRGHWKIADLMERSRDFGRQRTDVTQALREAGIPGIKYLDGMSRGAGEGSSNYVVFDDQLIDILRKYANAPTGAAVPAGMEASENEIDLTSLLAKILGGGR